MRLLGSFSLLLFAACQTTGLGGVQTNDAGGAPTDSSTVPNAFCGSTPQVLYSIDAAPQKILLTDDAIFVQASSQIFRSPKAAPKPTAFAWGELAGIDRSTIVWTDSEKAHAWASITAALAPIDLGVDLADFQGAYGGRILGVTGGELLWSDGQTGGGAYYTLPLSGNAKPVSYRLSWGWTNPDSWIAVGGAMYWIAKGSLWRSDLIDAAASSKQIATSVAGLPIIDAVANNVYLGAGLSVVQITLNDGSQTILGGGAPIDPLQGCGGSGGKYGMGAPVLGADQTAYAAQWADCLDGTFATTVFASVGQAAPEPLATVRHPGQQIIDRPIAVDDYCVYWLQNDSSSETPRTQVMTVAAR